MAMILWSLGTVNTCTLSHLSFVRLVGILVSFGVAMGILTWLRLVNTSHGLSKHAWYASEA